MPNHPIEGLMNTTMESLKEMVDVNTIVGDPVETPDGLVIIPISKVSLGFASGGTEFNGKEKSKENNEENSSKLPFGGGSGAGISVQPVAFIVVGNGQMKLLPVDQGSNILNNILDFIPKVSQNLQHKFKNNKDIKVDVEKDNGNC
ncbi:GerW family sporulation protein [Clostridium sp. D2Q-11]|uniref:GerW family sporulation protein n=1 Tax=Anaeromonas frigoriresistens TaxID=2683708 RepID=A0A942V037_9FIRM|nr:GerW family sporulation protein [Anaeromonas frigoriresistens]MBS4539959.1 GerW family sporulation protein [Anaeromonas frigoriresistens]